MIVNKDKIKKRFFDLFDDKTAIYWVDDSIIGVSLFRDYPKDGKFKPVLDRDGKPDNSVMVKICYDASKNKGKRKKLIISVFKHSEYLSKYHFYDFAGKNGPTRQSIKLSNDSVQPANLDNNEQYQYSFKENKIYDSFSKNVVTPEDICTKMYKAHIRTTTDYWFLMKVKFKEISLKWIDSINNFLVKLIYFLFGKKIKKSDDWFVGIYKPYNRADLIDSEGGEKPRILGSDFPISYRSAVLLVLVFSIFFLTNYFFKKDLLGFVALFDEANNNNIFLASLVSLLLILIDQVIPLFILLLMNILIKLKSWITFEYKISIN